jgi:hypothetical protein
LKQAKQLNEAFWDAVWKRINNFLRRRNSKKWKSRRVMIVVEHLKDAGFYDGRFSLKGNHRQKEASREKACKNVRWDDYEDDEFDEENDEVETQSEGSKLFDNLFSTNNTKPVAPFEVSSGD